MVDKISGRAYYKSMKNKNSVQKLWALLLAAKNPFKYLKWAFHYRFGFWMFVEKEYRAMVWVNDYMRMQEYLKATGLPNISLTESKV